jgi:hypothetical protein
MSAPLSHGPREIRRAIENDLAVRFVDDEPRLLLGP